MRLAHHPLLAMYLAFLIAKRIHRKGVVTTFSCHKKLAYLPSSCICGFFCCTGFYCIFYDRTYLLYTSCDCIFLISLSSVFLLMLFLPFCIYISHRYYFTLDSLILDSLILGTILDVLSHNTSKSSSSAYPS